MIKLNINLKERSYPIYITTDYTQLGRSFSTAKISGKIILITDTNVDKLQAEECINELTLLGYKVNKYVIEAGEKSKNLQTVNDIYKYLVDLNIDRSSSLIALGGGVVGDITGFVAATFLRGINFIQVPTTLLAQADSSVGGKVGVDFEGGKNIIGSFYQPKFVYINVNSIKTLPEREIKVGLAEIIKHGIIINSDFFDYIEYNINKIFKFDESVLQYLAKANCSIKGNVVEEDEKETGIRAILNFGHTIGHAIESAMNFNLLHGECVSLGMIAAFRIAYNLELVNSKEVDKVVNLLKKGGLMTSLPSIDVDEVYKNLFYDKKKKDDKLVFVLPKRIGEVIQCNVEDEILIKKVIESLRSE